MFVNILSRSIVLRGLLSIIVMVISLPAYAFPPVEEVRSDSGLVAWLVQDHALPIITVQAAFKHSGGAYAPEGKQGLPLLAVNMLMQGAGDKDYQAFHAAMENLGMSLGFSAGADNLTWSLQTLTEHQDAAFALLMQALHAPQLKQDALERLRSEMQASLDVMEQDPEYVADRLFRVHAFAGHPYRYATSGVKEDLANISVKDVRDYLGEHLTRKNLVIAVVGDITPDALKKKLDDISAALPQGDASSLLSLPETQMQFEGKSLHEEKNVPQTAVIFGLKGVKRDHPDFYAAYIMNQIVGGGGLTSRLAKTIREKGQASYYVYSGLQLFDATGVVRGAFASRTELVDKARQMLVDELKHAAEKGFTQDELDVAKEYLIGSFPIHLESNADLANYVLTMQLQELGRDYLTKRNQFIRAVTLADVNRVAKQYLDTQKLFVVSVGGK